LWTQVPTTHVIQVLYTHATQALYTLTCSTN